MLWVSVSSGVTLHYPPVVYTDSVCDFGEAWQVPGFQLWKVYSGAECTLSLCSSRGDSDQARLRLPALESLQWGGVQTFSVFLQVGDSGRTRHGLPALVSLQQGRVQTLSVLLHVGTVARQGAGFPLW